MRRSRFVPERDLRSPSLPAHTPIAEPSLVDEELFHRDWQSGEQRLRTLLHACKEHYWFGTVNDQLDFSLGPVSPLDFSVLNTQRLGRKPISPGTYLLVAHHLQHGQERFLSYTYAFPMEAPRPLWSRLSFAFPDISDSQAAAALYQDLRVIEDLFQYTQQVPLRTQASFRRQPAQQLLSIHVPDHWVEDPSVLQKEVVRLWTESSHWKTDDHVYDQVLPGKNQYPPR